MKNILLKGFLILVLITGIKFTNPLFSDVPPPPPPPTNGTGGSTGTENVIGGGTPVGDGVFILLSMAVLYGILMSRKRSVESGNRV